MRGRIIAKPVPDGSEKFPTTGAATTGAWIFRLDFTDKNAEYFRPQKVIMRKFKAEVGKLPAPLMDQGGPRTICGAPKISLIILVFSTRAKT